MQNPFENAMLQLQRASAYLDVDKNKLEMLKAPDRTIQVKVPVKMDNGSWKIFDGYRVQYNNALGPYKGGLRYFPSVDLNEVKALAFWMMIKGGLLNIPMGGGKGGVTVNPKELSKGELERLTRSFTRQLAPFIGSQVDVPAPDVYTNSEIMEWVVDEYAKVTGKEDLAVVTGKPLTRGGSKGRDRATAMGGFYLLQEVVKEKFNDQPVRVAIQGFGNAGAVMADLISEAGHKIVALSDSQGGIYQADGLNIEEVKKIKENHGTVTAMHGVEQISNEQLLEVECDILIPAALENQITQENAGRIKASVLMELANGPTTPEADEILNTMGITVIPDVLTNAGGVTVSYFEWKQNMENNYWEEETVFAHLKPKMIDAYQMMRQKAQLHKISNRTAAFVVSLERIISAIDLEGK